MTDTQTTYLVQVERIVFDFHVDDPAFGITTDEQTALTNDVTGALFTVEIFDDADQDEVNETVVDTITEITGWMIADLEYRASAA